MDSPNLFDTESQTNSSMPRSMGPLVVTNAPNYRHYRTHGLIAPKQVFGEDDKYHLDFLSPCEGRLPIFRGPLSNEIIEYVQQSSRRSDRPVILEVDATSLPDSDVEGLNLEKSPTRCIPGCPDALVTAPALVLPFSAVKTIHVLDEETKNLLLRDNKMLANLRELPESIIQVTPEVVSKTSLDLETVRSWLSSLTTPDGLKAEQFVYIDKTAGAAMLIGSRNSDLRDDALELLSVDSTPSDVGGIPAWILSREQENFTEEDPDMAVYQAAKSVIRHRTPDQFVPSEALEEIRDHFSSQALDEEHVSMVKKGLEKIGRILRNEESFDKVSSQDYPSLQGLMFFLIKQSPEDLIDWSPEDTNSSEEAHLTALAYSGLLHGRANLPLKFRPTELDERVCHLIAKRLSPLYNQPRLSPSQILDESGPEPREVLSRKIEEGNPRVEGDARKAVLHVCQVEGWKDCVETEVISPDRQPVSTYQTQKGGDNRKYKMAWSFNGVPDIQYTLDLENFYARLQDSNLGEQTVRDALKIFKEPGSS